jgi:hypothetical protein
MNEYLKEYKNERNKHKPTTGSNLYSMAFEISTTIVL